MRWSWNPGGRNEASTFLVLSLLLLVFVSSYTLFAYWTSLERLTEERQLEAAGWARTLAGRIGAWGPLPRSRDLRQWMPEAFALSIFDPDGRLLATSKTGEGLELVAVGEPFSPQTLVGSSQLVRDGRSYTIQVDLWSPTLIARTATMRVLLPLVLIVDSGVLLLLLLYTRRLLRPLDRFLDRARELGTAPAPDEEVAFLLRTFDSALERLAQPDELEIKALERVLGSSMESGVLLCDLDGRILALNPVGLEILGIEGEPVGEAIEAVLARHPEMFAKLGPALGRRQAVQREECRIQTPAGERVLGLTAHPLRRDDGQTRGFLVLFADLTEIQKRLADERLADSLKQLGELTAGIAHEMRNGLATVKGYLTLIQRGGDQDSINAYVTEMRSETDALHRTLEDFLTFARPGGGRAESVELGPLVFRAAEDPALGEARIRVEVELEPGDEATVLGDSSLLAKALANLLLNAYQAQTRAGVDEPVVLSLSRLPGAYQIRVLDSGIGVPEDLEDKIFDPFVTGRPEGVGLGLALTRRIALLHGGSITLNRRESGGTLAELWLPSGKVDTNSNN